MCLYSIFCLTLLQTNNLGGKYLVFKVSDDGPLACRGGLLGSDATEVCGCGTHPLQAELFHCAGLHWAKASPAHPEL